MSRTSRGRPRAFDKDETLEKAMLLFWDRGFEGASLDDLTAAMGISPSSLYSAYGGKEKLYFAALDRFVSSRGSYLWPILEESGPTTREAFRRLYSTAAFELLRSDQPPGCMLSIAGTHTGPGAQKIRVGISERRERTFELFLNRVERGKREGDLPPDTDANGLAHYLMAVYQGLSVQARDGADRNTLLAIGRNAIACFPHKEQQAPSSSQEQHAQRDAAA